MKTYLLVQVAVLLVGVAVAQVPEKLKFHTISNRDEFNSTSRHPVQRIQKLLPPPRLARPKTEKPLQSFNRAPLEPEVRPTEIRPIEKPIQLPENTFQTVSRPSEHLSSEQLEKRRREELQRKQAESAQYNFASDVDDGIMDHSHTRQEVRDGLKLRGMYAYSDGYYKRTVRYEADENGYRITGEEVQPIGDGPVLDVDGTARVQTHIEGVDTKYAITADDIRPLKELINNRTKAFEEDDRSFSRF